MGLFAFWIVYLTFQLVVVTGLTVWNYRSGNILATTITSFCMGIATCKVVEGIMFILTLGN